jgi:hypothetical protein
MVQSSAVSWVKRMLALQAMATLSDMDRLGSVEMNLEDQES